MSRANFAKAGKHKKPLLEILHLHQTFCTFAKSIKEKKKTGFICFLHLSLTNLDFVFKPFWAEEPADPVIHF